MRSAVMYNIGGNMMEKIIPESHKFLTKSEREEKLEEVKRLEELMGRPYEEILKGARAHEKSILSRIPLRDQ